MISDYVPKTRNHFGEKGRQIKDLEAKLNTLEKENAQLDFQDKQSTAQCRKLERQLLAQSKTLKTLQLCGACRCLSESRKSSVSRPYTAQVQDVPHSSVPQSGSAHVNNGHNTHTTSTASVSSGRVNNVTDEITLLRQANADLRALTERLRVDLQSKETQMDQLRAARADAGRLAEKEAEIRRLQKEINELVSQNTRLTARTASRASNQQTTIDSIEQVQKRVADFETELMGLRQERQRLSAESDTLRRSLNSTETNLLRCERELGQAMDEKRQLKRELERLRTRTASLEAEANRLSKSQNGAVADNAPTPSALLRRSRSESQLAKKQQPPARKHSANPYCPVCRNFRSDLKAGSAARRVGVPQTTKLNRMETVATPDSGFWDVDHNSQDTAKLNRRLQDQLKKVEMEKRLLEHEKQNLRQLYEASDAEATKLRRAYWLKSPEPPATDTHELPNSSDRYTKLLEKFRLENEKLRKHNQNLKDRIEDEKARYRANENLLKAQKTKAEQDHDLVRGQLNSLNETVTQLQHQLSNKELTVQQLRTQLSSLDTQNASSSANARIRDYENVVANFQSKYQSSESARTHVETKLADAKRELDKSEREVARLNTELTALRNDLQRLSEQSADAGQAQVIELKLQLNDKDREVTNLRSTVRELGEEYRRFQLSLSEQEQNLLRLQQDLSLTANLKGQAEQLGQGLETENARLRQKLGAAEKDNANLRLELQQAVDEQDLLKRKTQKYLNEIENFEMLLAEKERERSGLLAQLQDMSVERRSEAQQQSHIDAVLSAESQLRDNKLAELREQLEAANNDKQRILSEHSALQAQLRRCEASLESLKLSIETERNQKESLHNDLVSARQDLLVKDAENANLLKKLSSLDADLRKTKERADEAEGQLELEQSRAAS